MSCFWLLIIISQNQKSTNFIIIIVVIIIMIMIVAVAVVVVMIIIMMNNAVADQKWCDFFVAIVFGKIAKVKMLFEANRSLFLNSAFPHYAGLVWIPLTSSSSSLSSLSWSSFIWFNFIHSFICDMMMITIKWGRGRRTRSWSWLRWWLRWWRWSELFNNLMMIMMIMSIHLNYMMMIMMMRRRRRSRMRYHNYE